jgi:hypothetical protein
MGKHTSGKRISIRAPGRRKFKPGPRKSSGKRISVRALARRKIKPGPKKKIIEEQIEKMIRKHPITNDEGELTKEEFVEIVRRRALTVIRDKARMRSAVEGFLMKNKGPNEKLDSDEEEEIMDFVNLRRVASGKT